MLELRLIAARESENWKFAINPIFDSKLSQGFNKTPDFNIGMSVLKVNKGLMKEFGLEFYDDFGPIKHFSHSSQQAKQVFLVSNIDTGNGIFKDWGLHLGIGTGWNGGDHLTLKMIINPQI